MVNKVSYISSATCGLCKQIRPLVEKISLENGVPVEWVDAGAVPKEYVGVIKDAMIDHDELLGRFQHLVHFRCRSLNDGCSKLLVKVIFCTAFIDVHINHFEVRIRNLFRYSFDE